MNQIAVIETAPQDASAAQPLGMTEDQLERLIGQEIENGLSWIYANEDIAAAVERNYDFYNGKMDKYLPVAKGRSSVVDPNATVNTYIGMMLPSLLRVFTVGKNVAEYEPTAESNGSLEKLLTRYVNDVVFRKDNRGENILYQWAFDALVQKVGVLISWWEECYETEDATFDGLDDDGLAMVYMMAEERGAEIVAAETVEADGLRTHAVTVKVRVNRSKCRIENVPFEEFCISRDARNLEDAVLKSHRTPRKVGDLINEGYPEAVLDTLSDADPTFPGPERENNSPSLNRGKGSTDPMLREVMIHQGIVRCDYDGEGLKEWYFVAGKDASSVKVLKMEPYNYQIVFADFCPNPLPHIFWGRCPADDLAEIQKVNTVLVRQMLDNLYLSNTPQREVVQDLIVNPDQLMNMAPGSFVLTKGSGAIREISVPFVAGPALEAIQYFNASAETRSGVSKQSAGLDPNALANQSATAAQLAYSASQGKVEMIARIWAHGGMRKLFRGIFNILRTYQDFARIVRIEGRAIKVDPAQWRALEDVDVTVNTGLGTGDRGRDMGMLTALSQEAAAIIEKLGPGNPSVRLPLIVDLFKKKMEVAGIRNADALVPDMPPDWQPEPPAPPQPTPDALVFAEVEKFKAQTRLQDEDADRRADVQKFLAKLREDTAVAYYKTDVDAALEAEKLQIDAARLGLDAMKADASAAVDIMDIVARAEKAKPSPAQNEARNG